jgi:hypothetical protein
MVWSSPADSPACPGGGKASLASLKRAATSSGSSGFRLVCSFDSSSARRSSIDCSLPSCCQSASGSEATSSPTCEARMSAASLVGIFGTELLAAGEPPARRFFRRSASLSSRDDGGLDTSTSNVGGELSFTVEGFKAFRRARRLSSCAGMVFVVLEDHSFLAIQ